MRGTVKLPDQLSQSNPPAPIAHISTHISVLFQAGNFAYFAQVWLFCRKFTHFLVYFYSLKIRCCTIIYVLLSPLALFANEILLSKVHDEMMNMEPSKACMSHLCRSSTDWLRQQQDSDHSLYSNQQLPLQVSIKHWFFCWFKNVVVVVMVVMILCNSWWKI